jgi:acetoin utilization deacetylase AcuC-like enzyme
MHGEKNFPLEKMKSSLDINLPDKCDDSLYLKLLEENLPRVYELSKPDICFYLAGVDVVKVNETNFLTNKGR